ncbi:alpha-glycosidase [Candidatus Xianfuyuplasma coldseepsis]|uniref:Alpha-glycosidase n=2 Tax=Candidatus Xianfuyuplasma coldseepsis TaxID=2782163 RepID=A0A7L7KTJ3_9MOLU|nr:alpha-glycosidase [Xianfuyuplasma coldseepsis]
MYDKDTVHLRLIVQKNHIQSVRVLFGDPFHWGPSDTTPETWEWKQDSTADSYMTKEYETQDFEHYIYEATPSTKRMRYAFLIDERYLYGSRETIDVIEHPDKLTHHFNYFNYPFLNEEDMFSPPAWVQDQVWYAIFPERFANGDPSINLPGTLAWGSVTNYHNRQLFGGDLQGIIDHLDYIQDIGFTGIYMTPIFPSDSTHKYDVNDYFDIDPAFGDKETFKRLVEEAHKRDMKVMLDAVYNHCGFRHPYFQDVIKHGKQSKYYDCFYIIDSDKPVINFDIDAHGKIIRESAKPLFEDKTLLNYRTFAFTPYMPKMNTNHPLMKDYLLKAAAYWITEFDIDGWRLDVSNEVSHAFWRDFRHTVKTSKREAYIVGENWENSTPWLQGDQYDGVMNYELLFPIWDYFGTNIDHNQSTSTEFKYKVNQVLTNYPKNVLPSLYNLVDSHDTTRILEICSNNIELVKLPYLFLFSFPGAPSVYYGGEIGLSGKHDPDNRRCMPWDPTEHNPDLLRHIKRLIYLRKHVPALKSVAFRWIETNDVEEYLIYQKDDVYFILSKRFKELTITLPKAMQAGEYTDLYTDQTVILSTTLLIPSYGFFILQKK